MGTRKTTQKTPSALATLFGRARMEVLSLLYLNPQQSYYVREIIRRLTVAPSNVQKELAMLCAAGLIERHQAGRQVYYQAQRNNPIFKELQSIISKTFGLADRFRSSLKALGEIKFAFIFGSVARGEQISSNDIDLMVVGQASFEKISERLSALERELGRAVNLVSYSEIEFAGKIRDKHPFVTEVLAHPKIWIIGNDHDVEAVVGQIAGLSSTRQTCARSRSGSSVQTSLCAIPMLAD